MNYMTPELLARFQSPDDSTANAAADAWERNGVAYRGRLKEITADMPRALQRLVRRDRLHDARVEAIRVRPDRWSLLVALEGSNTALELAYRDVLKTKVTRHEQLAKPGLPLIWLYDEVDAGGEKDVWTHSILFTGGRELQLWFKDLRVRRFTTAVPGSERPGEGFGILEGLLPA
jgi:hypothetical protein